MTDLRDVDLNLLVVLDRLLEERKVVTAAERLGISQPSASAALERCRVLFGDQLLVRAGRGMTPTARGLALQAPIRRLLHEFKGLIEDTPPQARDSKRTVRLVSSDVPALMLLTLIWNRLRDTAPGIDLCLMTWLESEDVVDALARDRADLAITVLPQAGHGFRRVELFTETYSVVMRRDHPAADGFDLDRWLAHPHILVSATGARRSPLDDKLALLGRTRRVGMTVPSFLMVPQILASTDLIAMLPRRCMFEEADLVYLPPPIAVEGFPLHLAWATRAEADPAVMHVAERIREFAVDLAE
ncbi:LysR family transcriptional regulator [Euryhalocaulis caribicus]|uniref:LysR family transcriptional regulator n=1 Tax=Euryhalocaulis caribicus TaxID=1161401 RepID=UPI0003A224E7|nr:LysR family transcriptional regulator [Euryhalocaulis caribicus]